LSALYLLDTSAFLKLFVAESNSSDMLEFASREQPRLAGSELLITEGLGNLARLGFDTSEPKLVLESISLLPVTRSLLMDAVEMVRGGVRSLDAIHLATAKLIQSELIGLVSYDKQMLRAADQLGIPTFSPGVA
jgi:uncharacterized protein